MKRESWFGFILMAISVLLLPSFAVQTEKPAVAKVWMAGLGTQPDVQNVMDGLTEYLGGAGIKVRQVSTYAKSRTDIIDEMSSMGAESLLYFTLHLDFEEIGVKGVLQCYDAQGKKLWEEEGAIGRIAKTRAKAVQNVVKNLKSKLEKRIGGPGLPKS